MIIRYQTTKAIRAALEDRLDLMRLRCQVAGQQSTRVSYTPDDASNVAEDNRRWRSFSDVTHCHHSSHRS
jgi:hypothetical protein